MLLYCFTTLSLVLLTRATTEWFGDLRAHLNPDRAPAFYDVTYDETECPQGLRSDAVPEYVYFGSLLATLSVDEHDECLQHCAEKSRCKAVNFFQPLGYQERGFCELLTETQRDNPRLMRPFRNAVYYENIRCRLDEEDVDTVKDSKPLRTSTASKEGGKEELGTIMKKLSSKVGEFNKKFSNNNNFVIRRRR